jgi:hypothetical protein
MLCFRAHVPFADVRFVQHAACRVVPRWSPGEGLNVAWPHERGHEPWTAGPRTVGQMEQAPGHEPSCSRSEYPRPVLAPGYRLLALPGYHEPGGHGRPGRADDCGRSEGTRLRALLGVPQPTHECVTPAPQGHPRTVTHRAGQTITSMRTSGRKVKKDHLSRSGR